MSDDAPLRIEVTRTPSDFTAAVFANAWFSGAWGYVGVGAVVIAGITFGAGISQEDPGVLTKSAFAGATFFAIVAGVQALTLLLASRAALRLPGARDPVTYTFTPDALEVSSAIGSSKVQWVVWQRAFETKTQIILRQRMGLIHVLPKRFITSEQLVRLKALLRKVVQRIYFEEEPT